MPNLLPNTQLTDRRLDLTGLCHAINLWTYWEHAEVFWCHGSTSHRCWTCMVMSWRCLGFVWKPSIPASQVYKTGNIWWIELYTVYRPTIFSAPLFLSWHLFGQEIRVLISNIRLYFLNRKKAVGEIIPSQICCCIFKGIRFCDTRLFCDTSVIL